MQGPGEDVGLMHDDVREPGLTARRIWLGKVRGQLQRGPLIELELELEARAELEVLEPHGALSLAPALLSRGIVVRCNREPAVRRDRLSRDPCPEDAAQL